MTFNKNEIFKDQRVHLFTFADYFLVCCPKCNGPAYVYPKINYLDKKFWSARKLVCTKCKYFKSKLPLPPLILNEEKDWFFNLPLFLTASCCNQRLYAFNIEHLNFIEEFVSSKIISRKQDPKWGWSNQSLVSRLPKWIKSSKNKINILKTIKQLKARTYKKNQK